MIVNKGDNVTVHFYNVDPNTSERHSFTIGAPYNVDKDLIGGESAVTSFIADHEGIFQYYCKYHLPAVVLADIGDIIAYSHGLHFCGEVYPYTNRNRKKV
jgi:nitrous oxide reductase